MLILFDFYLIPLPFLPFRGYYNPDEFSYFKIFPKFIATLNPNSEVDIDSCFRSAKVGNLSFFQVDI